MMEWGREKKFQQKEEVVGKKKNKKRKKYDVEINTTLSKMLKDDDVDLVFVTTQHNMHAKMAIETAKIFRATGPVSEEGARRRWEQADSYLFLSVPIPQENCHLWK